MYLIATCNVCILCVYVVCPICTASTIVFDSRYFDTAAPLLQLVDFTDAGHANPHADDPAGQGSWEVIESLRQPDSEILNMT